MKKRSILLLALVLAVSLGGVAVFKARAEKETLVSLLQQLHDAKKVLRETIQSGKDETSIRLASSKVAAVEVGLAVERAQLHAKIAPM